MNRTDPTGEIGAGIDVAFQVFVEGKELEDVDVGDVLIVEIGSTIAREASPDVTVCDANEIVVTGERPSAKGFFESLRGCLGMCDGIKR